MITLTGTCDWELVVRKLKINYFVLLTQLTIINFFSKDICPETAMLNDDCSSTPCKCGRKGGLTCQNNICK